MTSHQSTDQLVVRMLFALTSWSIVCCTISFSKPLSTQVAMSTIASPTSQAVEIPLLIIKKSTVGASSWSCLTSMTPLVRCQNLSVYAKAPAGTFMFGCLKLPVSLGKKLLESLQSPRSSSIFDGNFTSIKWSCFECSPSDSTLEGNRSSACQFKYRFLMRSVQAHHALCAACRSCASISETIWSSNTTHPPALKWS